MLRAIGVFLLASVLLMLAGRSANADIPSCANSTGGVAGIGKGLAIQGKIGTQDRSISFAGVIFLDMTNGNGGQANEVQAFCIDLTKNISIGECFNTGAALTGNLWKAIHYYGPDNSLSDLENAARQAVVWQYSDNFVPTSPAEVVTRYNEIISDLNSKGPPPSSTPPIMTITPTSSTGKAGSSFPFEITVTQNGQPLPGAVTITLETSFGTLSTPSVTTNYQATFSISSATTGTANITARFSYSLPSGTQFNPVAANRQKLVLGQQTTGSVVTPASASWNAPTAVTLNGFRARAQKKQVKLAWQTGTELNVLGFNVWRSRTRNGTYEQLNATLIPAQAMGSVIGNRYTFQDKRTTGGNVYFYKLEVADARGKPEWSEIQKVRLR